MDNMEISMENFTTPSPNMSGENLSESERMLNEEYHHNMLEIVHFQYYAWGITGNIISGFGIAGNLMSIVVLANRRMRSSTSVYLIAQSVFDIIVLISLILFMALPSINQATHALETYSAFYPYLHPFAYPMALTAQTCSIYTTVGFTIERYIAVCYPLKAARWCTPQKAQRAVLLIVLASVLYNIPRMLEYKTVLYTNTDTNVTVARYVVTEMGANKVFRHVYFIYMHISVMLLIPFAILTFMNTMLIRAVRRSHHTKGKVNQKQHKENNLTVMLIAVVIVFLICQLPSIPDNIFMATLSADILSTPPFIKLTCIASLLVIANSAANFYLYCVFGKKFRKVFCHLFCGYCCRWCRGPGVGGMGAGKSFLEHETSLLRGSSIVHAQDGNGKSAGHKNGAGSNNTSIRHHHQQQAAPLYRYSNKAKTPIALKISCSGNSLSHHAGVVDEGKKSLLTKTKNSQQGGKYTSIADANNETNL